MEKTYPYARTLVLALFTLFIITSCDTNNADPKLDLIPVNETTTDGYTISLFALNQLETGANDLYWSVNKDGDQSPVETFSVMPMMDMGTMQHSTPHESPTPAEEDDQYFHNRTIFIMPSGDMGSWTISFKITLKTGIEIAGEMPIEVASSWKLSSVRDQNDRIYFITWLSPQKPISGNNELKFLVHTRESMMSFPSVDDAELILYPFMDMGGGQGHSTDFTTPVAQGNGLYKGDINYSMSGVWTTSVRIAVQNDTLPEVVFEYSVLAK